MVRTEAVTVFTRHFKGAYRDKNIFIEGICKNKEYHSPEFKENLTWLIKSCVADEYVEAIYDAMTSYDNLDRTAIDYYVSVPQLSRKINLVKANWDKVFKGWTFAPPPDKDGDEANENE